MSDSKTCEDKGYQFRVWGGTLVTECVAVLLLQGVWWCTLVSECVAVLSLQARPVNYRSRQLPKSSQEEPAKSSQEQPDAAKSSPMQPRAVQSSHAEPQEQPGS